MLLFIKLENVPICDSQNNLCESMWSKHFQTRRYSYNLKCKIVFRFYNRKTGQAEVWSIMLCSYNRIIILFSYNRILDEIGSTLFPVNIAKVYKCL